MPIKVFKTHHIHSLDLENSYPNKNTIVPVPGLVVSFTVKKTSHVFISGSVGYTHRKIPLDGTQNTEYAVGIVGRLAYTDENGVRRWIKGSKWGTNIAGGKQHYGIIPVSGYIEVKPGTHEIAYWAECHTDAQGAPSHPVEIKGAAGSDQPGGTSDPYNQMIVRIEPK